MDDCIFCKIVKGDLPSSGVMETINIKAFDNNNPVAEHHVLIIPKEHIASFTDLEENHKDTFMEMAEVAQEIIKDRKISDGYKLVFNGGKYQTIKHIHWHLLGGKFNDTSDISNKL
jgi:histidine triad (HIT) family protein